MKTKYCYCKKCLTRFSIEVEPDYSIEDLIKQSPESLVWFKKINYCPVCKTEIKDI